MAFGALRAKLWLPEAKVLIVLIGVIDAAQPRDAPHFVVDP